MRGKRARSQSLLYTSEPNWLSDIGLTSEYVAQGSCGFPIPGCAWGQAGQSPGQPDLLGHNQHTAGVELDGLEGSFQPTPFCDSMTLELSSKEIQ